MQLHWRPEYEGQEPRYSVEAVRKATRIAAELERHRDETLSVSEIEELARELEIDPRCMRRALEEVEPEPPVSPVPRVDPGTRSTRRKHNTPRQLECMRYAAGTPTLGERLRWGLAAGAAGLVLSAVWLGAAPRNTVFASPVSTSVGQAVRLHPIGTVPANSVILNGDFSTGPKQPIALTSEPGELRGWQITQGKVTYLPHAPGAQGGSVRLQEGGTVRQLFRTQPYTSYHLSLDLSGEQGSYAALHRLAVSVVGDLSASAVHFTEAAGQARPGWSRFTMSFEAREPGTTIEIRVADEMDGGGGAPIIDNVAVVPVVPR